MTATLIPLICPACHTLLRAEVGQHTCPTCRQIYPHTLDIPDLCSPEDKSSSAETTLVKHLYELYPTATPDEMVLVRLSALLATSGFTSLEQRQQITQYGLVRQTRGQRFCRVFQRMLAQHFPIPRPGSALDVGCGTGAGIVALAANFEQVVGLDISMSALIVAKKLIESKGLTNVTLVRGNALNLPLSNNLFDYCMAINVLEHIFEPAAMLREIHRVLAVNGVFSGDSRNRFDLFFPEPHVNLRWVGFLPRTWVEPYVRWRKGINHSQTHTHLLSYGDLRRALKASFGNEWHVVVPDVSVYGMSGFTQRLVKRLDRAVFLRPILIRMSPSHWVLARRVG